ncbi:HNH endonuclease [Rhodococcus spelaei]|uniref:HNH endonuclease n=1 Tax=Rhodococcus spelaei TaxID=2546320 RepID=A0A541B4N3_9NOCA|nr:HNH endonuclease [Rhodococcus spelaei]TQF67270.1 HNH endonuclease [Rhodococcus spelaei]
MKYTREVLQEAVQSSQSVAGVMRYLGLSITGGSHAHLSRRIKKFEIDTSHFTGSGHQRGQSAFNRLTPADILVVRPPGSARAKPHHLRRALVESGVPYACSCCGIPPTWNGAALTLHVDHVNGDYLDCRRENLRFLCPNCHTQTASWAGRNRSARTVSGATRGDAVA